ncbi:MAG: hypothetical protein ACR2PS_17455 [Pseudomonadales bacterium]
MCTGSGIGTGALIVGGTIGVMAGDTITAVGIADVTTVGATTVGVTTVDRTIMAEPTMDHVTTIPTIGRAIGVRGSASTSTFDAAQAVTLDHCGRHNVCRSPRRLPDKSKGSTCGPSG